MTIEQPPTIDRELTPAEAWAAAGPQFEELVTTRDLGDNKHEMATVEVFLA